MKRLLILLLLPAFSSAQTPKARAAAVEQNLIPYVPVSGFPGWNLQERMRYHRIPGASIAVIRNFKIDWARSYGFADTTKGLPVTNETMFSAGSISKLAMATIALRLVDRGLLSLDAPINNYLSSWKITENDFTRKKPVTLRMLLSHTAGTSQSSYFGYLPEKHPLPSIVDILSGAPGADVNPVVVNSEPGAGFRYSGGGSLIAQMAIMDVLKKDFATIAEEELFRPLGMRNSTFAQPLPGPFSGQAAWGYSAAPWYEGTPYVYPQQAAAGLYTTATDLAKLIIGLQQAWAGTGKLLPQGLARAMMTPQAVLSDGTYKEQIGLGAFLLEQKGTTQDKGRYFEHQGANAGFIALAIGSLTGGNGMVILMNSGDDFNGFGTEVRRAVAKVYGWNNFLPPAIHPVSLSAAELEGYTGRYRKGEDEVLRLRREGNYLVENINNGKDIYCFAVAKDTIVFTDYNVKGFFRRSDSGVTGLRNEYMDTASWMPRMKEDEFTPSELLAAGRYPEAKEGFRRLKLNVYRLTMMAWERMRSRPAHLPAARALLELAEEQFPNESIVFSRWGDYFKATGDKAAALSSYQKALALEPGNQEVQKQISQLRNP